MKSKIGLSGLLVVLCIINACDSWTVENVQTVEYAIPKGDKCEYKVGDTLLYKCSDDQYNIFLVNEVSTYYLEVLGNTQEYQKIIIENISGTLSDKNLTSYMGSCYTISVPHWSSGADLKIPHLRIYETCGATGISPIIAHASEITYDSKIFNNKEYHNVYKGGYGSLFYYSLKYGIIQYVKYADTDSTIYWDLEGRQ